MENIQNTRFPYLASNHMRLKLGLLVILLLGSIWIISEYFGTGFDWIEVFRPAAKALLSGLSPYSVYGFFSPPWVLVPFMPLAFLPENLSSAILFMANLLSFGYVAYKLGAKPIPLLLLVFSPHVIYGSFMGNTDWIAILGFLLPPQIGLFFVLVKPQIGTAIAIFWLIDAWRTGGFKLVIKIFGPVTIALLLSFIFYGFWPLNFFHLPNVPWNTSLFPYSIPIALVLLSLAIKNRKLNFAIVASPFLSPYVAPFTWPVAILGLLPSKLLVIVAVLGLWLIEIVTGFTIMSYWFLGKS